MTERPNEPLPFPDEVDVAIVSHDGRATLPRVLDCLRAAGAPLDRIVVFDIGSTDGTGEWLARDWPDVKIRRIEENVGPNPARNRALRDATRAALLLLDSDAYLRPDAPALLKRTLDSDTRIGTVAPVVVHASNPGTIQYASVELHYMCEAVNRWVGRPLVDRGREPRDIGSAPGVALMIERHRRLGRAVFHGKRRWRLLLPAAARRVSSGRRTTRDRRT
jgi:glycosyltransferase involved in cell wall biosynthesis